MIHCSACASVSSTKAATIDEIARHLSDPKMGGVITWYQVMLIKW